MARTVPYKRLKNERDEVILFSGAAIMQWWIQPTDLMSLLNANSYQKGGWVLHMLRMEVGDSSFRKIIRTYYDRFKGKNAQTADFAAIAREVSGKDLGYFFRQWLFRPGVPQLEISTKVEASS
jgi:aminopeptidase N